MSASVAAEKESSSSSAATTTGGTAVVAARSSIWESLKACGLLGERIEKEELRRRILIPEYLRRAMVSAVSGEAGGSAPVQAAGGEMAPEAPVVVFINSRSGGRHGPELKRRLDELICEEQVFDLSVVKPNDFLQHGLTHLESLAEGGDECAKDVRERLRIVVAGGDGTVGWILGSLTELDKQKRKPIPPTGIIPLGTGNDLSRTFGWGGSFPFAWRSAVKQYLHQAITAPISRLDSWQIILVMPEGQLEDKNRPPALKSMDLVNATQEMDNQEDFPEKAFSYGGVFYNYFSIGMDAQVAYGFHHLRNEKPGIARGPIANKMIYVHYSCAQGWFCTPCVATPNLRGLNKILRLYVKKANCSDWEMVKLDSSVRSIVALNLNNYGGGRHPWGNLDPEYLEKRGFVKAQVDDGLIEIFGLKEGWHASFVMTQLITAKHLAQAAAVKFEFRGGYRNNAYLQMDGEPWEQPLHEDHPTILEIKKVPFHSLMLNGQHQ